MLDPVNIVPTFIMGFMVLWQEIFWICDKNLMLKTYFVYQDNSVKVATGHT